MKLSTELDKYNIIGIDFDNTLIGNAASDIIANYVIQNPNKKYYIVTFRSHGLESSSEISKNCITYLRKDMRRYFIDILAIPYVYVEHKYYADHRKNISIEDYNEYTYNYVHWKGKICSEYNIEVLIDDDIKNVILGCNKYNINLIDTNDINSL